MTIGRFSLISKKATMQRLLLTLAAVPVLAVAVTAQGCFEQSFGVLMPLAGGQAGYGDDVAFDPQFLGFNFPMAGNLATYDSCQVSENGIMFLTNGGAATNGPTGPGLAYQPLNVFLGDAPGDDPRIAPLFSDLWSQPAQGGGVFYNDTIPGKFIVTWHNMIEWYATTIPGTPQVFSFQVQLLDSGEIQIFHDGRYTGTVDTVNGMTPRTGISEANGVADPGATDLSAGTGTNLSSFVMYEEWPQGGVFDLNNTHSQFINAGTGYVQVIGPCAPAYHANYGTGCYDLTDSIYELLPDSSTAPAELDGNSVVFTPAGTDYLVQWGGASYVTPVGSTPLVIADDGEVAQALSAPFPSPVGPVPALFVAANGVVSLGTNAYAQGYVPAAAGMLDEAVMGFYAHHDYNPTEAGSGSVTYFEQTTAGETTAYITWEGVESYSVPAALNPSTLQFQFNLTTGSVAMVFEQIDGDNTSAFGSAHLIGWSPGGASNDGGSIDLATALPILTSDLQNVNSLELSASGAPISTATSGATVTYTTDNMLEFAPGVYIGLNILSVNQVAGGLDLGFLGAPGCSAYVQTLDLTQAMVGGSSSQSVTLPLPVGLPTGLTLFSQSVCLIQPNSLPNGLNDFGMTVSNGVLTYVSTF